MAKRPKQEKHDMPVAFAGLGVNNETVRLGIRIEREKMKLALADELFAGSELAVVLTCDPNAGEDAKGQNTMPHAAVDKLRATARVIGYRVTRKAVATSLQFTESAVDVAKFVQFANSTGRVMCERVGDADGPDEDGGG